MPRREIAPGRSCFECRRRKIKCDRSHPCSYCVKVRIVCKYPSRRGVVYHDEEAITRLASLETNLQAFESRLSEIGLLFPSTVPPTTQTLAGKQNHQTQDAEQPETAQAPNNLDLLRPSSPLAALLWQAYLERVDPVLKVFHTPTVQRLVMKAIYGQDELDLASECLLFSIYYAAVASMSAADCEAELKQERPVQLKRYRTAVDHLLSCLNLRESLDMTGLQAFAIYLITARLDNEGPNFYALVGLAVGIALKMGLNRDGEALGLSPFQTEMRRRLWWHLCILDIRIAEDRQSEPCILESSFNTRLPSNIADTNLHPDMSKLPVVAPGRTEMLFSLVRFEGSYFARQMVFSDAFCQANAYMALTGSQKCQAIDLFQGRLEKQYLSHCDESVPLDKVTAQSIRLLLTKLKLVVNHPRAEQNAQLEELTTSRKAWIRILLMAEELRKYEGGRRWLWLFQTYIEWDALAHLLLDLRAGQSEDEDEPDQAWEVAYRVYNYWRSVQTTPQDPRWKRIEDLRLQVLVER